MIFIHLQIPVTTTRILLNHFKWDKEKLMERFYDGDQEKLFLEAHVISPYKGPCIAQKVMYYTDKFKSYGSSVLC